MPHEDEPCASVHDDQGRYTGQLVCVKCLTGRPYRISATTPKAKPKKLAYLGMKLAYFAQIDGIITSIYRRSVIHCHDIETLPKGKSYHQQGCKFGVSMDRTLVNEIDEDRQPERIPRSAWLARAARRDLDQRRGKN
jgi:hypothetical protein